MGLFVALLGLLVAAAGSEPPRVSDVRVTLDGPRVLVSFRLENAFDQRIVERVESGLPTAFVFELGLMRDRKRWWDKGLEEGTLEVVAMYNPLAREYLINYKLNGKLMESRMATSLDELEKAMTRIDALPAFSLEGITTQRRLLVRVRARLASRTLFSLLPTEITTGWTESRKFRPPGGQPQP